MGPLVTAAHRDKVASYVEEGVTAGARLVVDGRHPEVDGDEDGFWLGSTLFDAVRPEMSIYTDEIFGPVLSVVRVRSYDEALDLVNADPYGNGTAIFTNDGGAARRYQNEVESAWSASTSFRCRWPTTPSAAGRARCSATATCTAPRVSTSSPAGRW